MPVNEQTINNLRSRLATASPELRGELEQLIRQAQAPARKSPVRVEYVEVTNSDGTKVVMTAASYTRLTALDLAHTKLRMLSETEINALQR